MKEDFESRMGHPRACVIIEINALSFSMPLETLTIGNYSTQSA